MRMKLHVCKSPQARTPKHLVRWQAEAGSCQRSAWAARDCACLPTATGACRMPPGSTFSICCKAKANVVPEFVVRACVLQRIRCPKRAHACERNERVVRNEHTHVDDHMHQTTRTKHHPNECNQKASHLSRSYNPSAFRASELDRIPSTPPRFFSAGAAHMSHAAAASRASSRVATVVLGGSLALSAEKVGVDAVII